MKKVRKIVIYALVVVVLLVGTFIVKFISSNSKTDNVMASENKLSVEVYKAELKDRMSGDTYKSTLEAYEQEIISSKISAKVTKVVVENGQYVNEGDTIAVLDDQDIQNSIKTATAQLEVNEKQVNSAEQQLNSTQTSLEKLKINVDDDQRKSIEDLNEIYVSGTNNKLIPVNQVSKKVIGRTSSSLHRYNKQAEVSLSCNVKGKAAGTFQTEYLNKIKSELPDGVSLSVGGMNGTMQKSLSSFGLCALLSIVFLYLVMAAQFESFVEPMAVMFALPLAMIGAIIALFICRSELSIMALIGIVMLMGLVAKNGILLIDAAKERMENGMNRNEALVEAGFVRLRPIIMTTLAMILGMLPTAVATGAGTEMRKPMAEAVIGGLITSTILTLFVVPIAYTLLDGLKRRILKIFSKNLSPKDIHKDLELQEELKK